MVSLRLAKVALVTAVGVFCVLVGYNNIVDYRSNYMFVQHVLSMDTTFPDNSVRGTRALLDPRVHTAAYWLIIAAELTAGLICLAGAARLLAALRGSAAGFNAAKATASLGLASGMLLWFLGFLVVGGEWFQMWQSQIWNGEDAAFRILGSIGVILVFLTLDDH